MVPDTPGAPAAPAFLLLRALLLLGAAVGGSGATVLRLGCHCSLARVPLFAAPGATVCGSGATVCASGATVCVFGATVRGSGGAVGGSGVSVTVGFGRGFAVGFGSGGVDPEVRDAAPTRLIFSQITLYQETELASGVSHEQSKRGATRHPIQDQFLRRGAGA